jgi:2-deoxy-D-gluconate 3-dehydrogenase
VWNICQPANAAIVMIAEKGSCAMNLFDLTGKVALVTGGNSGIGLGMAKGLAQAGAAVVIAARNAEKAQKALAELGPNAAFVAVEIAEPESCQAMVRETVARFGRLDILVSNAGVNHHQAPGSQGVVG